MFLPQLKFVQKALVYHLDNSGRFLTLQRSLSAKTRPGLWDFPGGNVEYGEELEVSLQREIQEEIGSEVTDIHIVHLTGRDEPDFDRYWLFAGYTANAITESVILSEEHIAYQWVTKEEFLKLESAGFLETFVQSLSK